MQEITFPRKVLSCLLAEKFRREIHSITQIIGETIHEYSEKYNVLLASFPHHKIQDELIIQYFYEGLLPTERGMIDSEVK